MTKSYKNLQAKFQELQSILDEALLLGPESQSHESISNDIKQKLAFIGNLLSAQVASHPTNPNHLHHISERLSIMERDFHHWDSFRSLPSHDFDKDSTCSCTDDGEALDDTHLNAFEDPQKLNSDFKCEKAMVEYSDGYAREEKRTEKMKNGFDKLVSLDYEDAAREFDGALLRKTEDEGKKDNNDLETFGERCCALAGGVVIGIVLMGFIMVNTSGCFRYVEQVCFAVPT